MNENSMVIFTEATRLLVEANTIQKAHELKNLALTAAEWAKRKGLGEDAIKYAKGYALDAERKMGEMLKQTERAKGTDKGGRQYVDSNMALPSNAPPTLAELGLTKRESSEAQKLAEIPDDKFEEIKAGKKSKKQVFREQKREERVKNPPQPLEGKYRVIYADPPWKYGDQLTENYGAIRFHYEPMSIKELCELPVKEILENDSVLFLWVTSPILPECFDVIKAWGFEYKASFVWDKIKHNMGHYNSVRHELLLICTKGSCLPDNKKLYDSVISIERSEHSEKPNEFREIIDELYFNGNRIELFARGEIPKHWKAWGNEII